MEIIKTICPACESSLEFPRDFESVICPGCGTTYQVREYRESLGLSAIERKADRAERGSAQPNGARELAAIRMRLEELDEQAETVRTEIELLRSKEQGGPLQAGCAFFGIFGLILLIIAFFVVLGRSLVGGWIFYLALASIIALGLLRARKKLLGQDYLNQLREDRLRLQESLARLEAERKRLQDRKQSLASKGTTSPAESNGNQD